MKLSTGILIGIVIGIIIGYLVFGLTINMYKGFSEDCMDEQKEMMEWHTDKNALIDILDLKLDNCEMREDAYIMDLEDAYDIDLYGGGGAR